MNTQDTVQVQLSFTVYPSIPTHHFPSFLIITTLLCAYSIYIEAKSVLSY